VPQWGSGEAVTASPLLGTSSTGRISESPGLPGESWAAEIDDGASVEMGLAMGVRGSPAGSTGCQGRVAQYRPNLWIRLGAATLGNHSQGGVFTRARGAK
jgi:hypothetical protein